MKNVLAIMSVLFLGLATTSITEAGIFQRDCCKPVKVCCQPVCQPVICCQPVCQPVRCCQQVRKVVYRVVKTRCCGVKTKCCVVKYRPRLFRRCRLACCSTAATSIPQKKMSPVPAAKPLPPTPKAN